MARSLKPLIRNVRLAAIAALFAAANLAALASAPARAYTPAEIHEQVMAQERLAKDFLIKANQQAIDNLVEETAEALEESGNKAAANDLRSNMAGAEDGADAKFTADSLFLREGGDDLLNLLSYSMQFDRVDQAAALYQLKNLGDSLVPHYNAIDGLKGGGASLGADAGDTQPPQPVTLGTIVYISPRLIATTETGEPDLFRARETSALAADLGLAAAGLLSDSLVDGERLFDETDWERRIVQLRRWAGDIDEAVNQLPAGDLRDTVRHDVDGHQNAIIEYDDAVKVLLGLESLDGEQVLNGSDVAKEWPESGTGQSTPSQVIVFPFNQDKNNTRVTDEMQLEHGDRLTYFSPIFNSVKVTVGVNFDKDQPLPDGVQPVEVVLHGSGAGMTDAQKLEIVDSDTTEERLFEGSAATVRAVNPAGQDFDADIITIKVTHYFGNGSPLNATDAKAPVKPRGANVLRNDWGEYDYGGFAFPNYGSGGILVRSGPQGRAAAARHAEAAARSTAAASAPTQHYFSRKDHFDLTLLGGFTIGGGYPAIPVTSVEWNKPAHIAPFVANDRLFRSRGSWGQPYDDQWGLKRIGLDRDGLHAVLPDKATPVTVAVLDTGADRYHPELVGAIWRNPNEIPRNGKDDDGNGFIDDTWGWNFVDDSPRTMDLNGHGTVTAGIIAAWPGNRTGIAGVNPWARIMPVKVANFLGDATSIRVARGIYYAVDNGARVINISIAGKKLSRVVFQAILYARRRGVLVVAAAGNDGADISNITPGGLPGVITVSSTDPDDKRVGFSNWGPQVEIAAPGVDILSLRARQTDLLQFERADYKPGTAIVGRDKRYYRVTGTSFSAPFVSGVASLIFSLDPKRTAGQVKRMIIHSAKDIDIPGVDNFTGYGLLDTRAAIGADPDFFAISRIGSVALVQKDGAHLFQPRGTAAADKFRRAWLEVGKGENPSQWTKASEETRKEVRNAALPPVPITHFTGAGQWTLKLVVEHQNGFRREARFALNLQ